MMGYYTANVGLSCFALCVLSILVFENGRFQRKTKCRFYETYALIIVSALAEWSGIFLNGAPQWTVGIHYVVKCMDYIATPIAGAFFALLVSDGERWKRNKILKGVLFANAIFQVVSAFTGWTFYIDADNYYHHGPLYFVYVMVYCLSIVFVLVEFRVYGKQFKRKNSISLYAIIALVCTGIGLQEFGTGDIRTSCFSLTLGSAFLFIHYSEFLQQRSDANLSYQRKLIETDALTGMLSRYAYIKMLEEYNQKEILPPTLVVFSMDINGLKTVNDTLGHEAGDELICGAAECISKALGEYGRCFRTGGDEFIAVLDLEKKQIPKVRKMLDHVVKQWKGTRVEQLSVSAGYAAAEYPGLAIEKMVNVADRMMYKEKEEYYRQTGGK